MFQDLSEQRRLGSKGLLIWLWLQVPLQVIAMLGLGRPWVGATLAVAACAATVTLGVALMCSISLLLASFRDHRWQTDLHMYYFAVLAFFRPAPAQAGRCVRQSSARPQRVKRSFVWAA